MWWIVAGIIIFGVLMMASLCDIAHKTDKQSDDAYQTMYRSDNDGNN